MDHKSVRIDKLTANVSGDHLKEIFSLYGTIESVCRVAHLKTKLPRSHSYVTFTSASDAQEAQEHMNGGEIDGKVVRVVTCEIPDDQDNLYESEPEERKPKQQRKLSETSNFGRRNKRYNANRWERDQPIPVRGENRRQRRGKEFVRNRSRERGRDSNFGQTGHRATQNKRYNRKRSPSPDRNRDRYRNRLSNYNTRQDRNSEHRNNRDYSNRRSRSIPRNRRNRRNRSTSSESSGSSGSESLSDSSVDSSDSDENRRNRNRRRRRRASRSDSE